MCAYMLMFCGYLFDFSDWSFCFADYLSSGKYYKMNMTETSFVRQLTEIDCCRYSGKITSILYFTLILLFLSLSMFG